MRHSIYILLLLVGVVACSKMEGLDNYNPEGINTRESYRKTIPALRSANNRTVEELRQYLLKKYTPNLEPLNTRYQEYGKIGCGYNFYIADPEDDEKSIVNLELETQGNIKAPILRISDATIDRIDINPLDALDTEIRAYYNFQKDFSSFFHSVVKSTSFGAGVTLSRCKWLAEASAAYERTMHKETKSTTEESLKTIFFQTSALIKSKRVQYNLIPIKRFTPDISLSEVFFVNYHTLPAKELIDECGPFVLTNYNLGGRAMATIRYTGAESKTSNELKQEGSKMASYSCSGLFGTISANYKSSSKEAKDEYTKMLDSYKDGYIKVAYRGGDVYNNFPQNIGFPEMKTGDFPVVDLSGWARSVEQRPQLISINGSGLRPIFDFIREINIAERVKHFFLTGEDFRPDNSRIKYEFYRHGHFVTLVMYTKYGDTIILDRFEIDNRPGFEWWRDYNFRASAIPFSSSLEANFIFGNPPSKGVIDLSEYLSAYNRSKIKVEFCKIEDGRYDDFTYLVIHNVEKGKKVALSFFDEEGFEQEYLLEKPESFKYVKNLNYVDVYGI